MSPRSFLAVIALGSLSALLVTCTPGDVSAPNRPGLAGLAGSDLLLDGGFENGGADWLNSAASGRSLDGSRVHSGAWSQLIVAAAAQEYVVYQDVAVVSGESYDVAGWVNSDGLDGTDAIVELIWLDAAGLPEAPPPSDILDSAHVGTLAGTQDWTRVAGRFTAPPNAAVARFQLRVGLEPDDLGSAWFDDDSLAAVPAPPPPDLTPPTVAITAPAAGSLLSGTVTVSADATDDNEVGGVLFQVDGSDLANEVLSPPYEVNLDSHSLPDGPHTLTAIARDTAGNTTISDPIGITVKNHASGNVVVVMTDDQRYDVMQYMPLTSSVLNAETVRFSRALVTTSLCCPSRSSFLTGLYTHNHHVLTNAAPTGGATVFSPASTIATWLHQAGYRTGLIGKYMNEYNKLSPAIPPGWDDFQVFSMLNGAYYNYTLNENGRLVSYGNGASVYSTDLLLQKANQFIVNTPALQPLFLMFTPYAPHEPFTPAPQDAGSFANFPPWRPPSFNEANISDKPAWLKSRPKLTAAKIAALDKAIRNQLESLQAEDRAVASIVATLKAQGRWETTLMIFMSDNGILWGEHRMTDAKNCPYQECIRVPLWVRMPGLTARTDTSLVANIDMAPSIAAWAGVTPATPVNGQSILPLLQNPATPWRSSILIEHLGDPLASKNSSAIRTHRYMYAEYQNGNKELYDLLTDPWQLTNVASKTANKNLIASLRAQLLVLKAQ